MTQARPYGKQIEFHDPSFSRRKARAGWKCRARGKLPFHAGIGRASRIRRAEIAAPFDSCLAVTGFRFFLQLEEQFPGRRPATVRVIGADVRCGPTRLWITGTSLEHPPSMSYSGIIA